MKRLLISAMLVMILLLAGCGNTVSGEKTTISIFAAKSLSGSLDELIRVYSSSHDEIEFSVNYDSSGTLAVQIEEGATCDLFFSAAQKQMNELEDKGYLVDGTRTDVVNNQVCVVTYKGSKTKVKGLKDLRDASSIALADGTVPVGMYTRQALVNSDVIPPAEDVSLYTAKEISEILGGTDINDCANAGAVAAAVAEGSNEIGTVYISDTAGYEGRLKIIEVVPEYLTGKIVYPIAGIKNRGRTSAGDRAILEFIEFLRSDEAKIIFEKYYFDTDVK